MKKEVKAIKQTKKTLGDLMDVFDKSLLALISGLELSLFEKLNALEKDKDGKFISSSANRSRAISIIAKFQNEAKNEIRELTQGWVSSFDKVSNFSINQLKESGFDVTATETDQLLLDALKDSSRETMNSAADQSLSDMTTLILTSVIVGSASIELSKQIKGRLTDNLLAQGSQIRTGRSLASALKLNGHDSLMFTYRSMHEKKSRDAGVKKFVYLGPDDNATRDFCQDRVNQVFTAEEIESWNDLEWNGKIVGRPVQIALGGFGCRHHLQSLSDVITEEDLGLPTKEDENG